MCDVSVVVKGGCLSIDSMCAAVSLVKWITAVWSLVITDVGQAIGHNKVYLVSHWSGEVLAIAPLDGRVLRKIETAVTDCSGCL